MRLAPLRKHNLVGEQAKLYGALVGKSLGRSESFALNQRGEVRGPLAVLLHHPASGWPLQELAAVLRFSGLLPDAAREAVILVVAAFWRDEHEWTSHEHIARAAGMTSDELISLRRGDAVIFADPATQAAYAVAHAIVTTGDLSNDEYAAARAVFDEERIVEITVLIGYYSLLSMQLRVFRVPAPAERAR